MKLRLLLVEAVLLARASCSGYRHQGNLSDHRVRHREAGATP
jgi:hypothetical protein